MSQNRRFLRFACALLPLAFLSVVGCGDDDDGGTGPGGGGPAITVPASWGGTWAVTSTDVSPSPRGGATDISIDPLCGGITLDEVFDFDSLVEGFDVDFVCTGTWDDARADVTCTGSYTISEEGYTCTITYTLDLDVSRAGDTFTGTQTMTIAYEGDCESPTENYAQAIEGLRLDTSQATCGNFERAVPVAWGGTWEITDTPDRGGNTFEQLICPGEDINDLFFGSEQNFSNFESAGGFTDTGAEVFGSYTADLGNCIELRVIRFTLDRTGEAFSGSRVQETITVDAPNGSGGCSGETTESSTITADRLSDDVSACTGGATEARPDESRAPESDRQRIFF
jgi:hypothetical protein